MAAKKKSITWTNERRKLSSLQILDLLTAPLELLAEVGLDRSILFAP